MTEVLRDRRARGAARFEELSRERHRLERLAEDRMAALREALDRLRVMDEEQRSLFWCVDLDRATARTRLGEVLAGWLGVRLGGNGGYARLLSDPRYEPPLPELDRLAKMLAEPTTRGARR